MISWIIHVFWVVLTYDLFEDTNTDYTKQIRFRVAMRLFSKHRETQMTAKGSKNISDTLGCAPLGHFFVLTRFWHHLWSITEHRHGSMEFLCLLHCYDWWNLYSFSRIPPSSFHTFPIPLNRIRSRIKSVHLQNSTTCAGTKVYHSFDSEIVKLLTYFYDFTPSNNFLSQLGRRWRDWITNKVTWLFCPLTSYYLQRVLFLNCFALEITPKKFVLKNFFLFWGSATSLAR